MIRRFVLIAFVALATALPTQEADGESLRRYSHSLTLASHPGRVFERPTVVRYEVPEYQTRDIPEYVTGDLPIYVTREIPEYVTRDVPEYVTGEVPEYRRDEPGSYLGPRRALVFGWIPVSASTAVR